MSVRDTTVLNASDLRYLLIDSLRLYSSNVNFIDGKNPYRFSINRKEFYVLIKNVHESGDGRSNPDECRIQVSESQAFNRVLSGRSDVVVLGYYADKKVFTAWNPFLMRPRFNEKQTVSLYSRFSVQESAVHSGIANYVDSNGQSVISFRPEYLGLYLDNVSNIHLLSNQQLIALSGRSDELEEERSDGTFDADGERLVVTHTRYSRDPKFRKLIYDAYCHKCAMCGIQLELIEAAHIVPHSHEKGTDEVGNGVCLCSLHHAAYDQSLVYFDRAFDIKINNRKMKYLEKIGRDAGYRKLVYLTFGNLRVPDNDVCKPIFENIDLANQIRGIEWMRCRTDLLT